MRRLYLNSLVFVCAVALFLLSSCSEECGVCPNGDDPGGQTPAGWFEQTVTTDEVYYGIHVFNANVAIAVGEAGVIRRTADGGDTWTVIDGGTNERLSAVSFVDDNTGWAAGINSVILKSTDGGLTWTPQDPGVTTHFRAVHFIDENTGWAGAAPWGTPNMSGYVIKTTNGGDVWTTQLDAATNAVCFADADSGCVGAANGVQRTIDGGDTWNFVAMGAPGAITHITFVDPATGWVGGQDGFVAKTIDGGATWSPQDDGTDRGIGGLSFVSPDKGWYIAAGTIARTIDGGNIWSFQTCPTASGLRDVGFVDENVGWIVGYEGTILKTVTGGELK